jgi:hypothetical protein
VSAIGWNATIPNYTSTNQGVALDRQIAWSTDATWTSGKPAMTFIGTSEIVRDVTPAPTESEFNVQAWSSVIHGATGVIYFPVQLPDAQGQGWQFDATPPDLVDALTSFDHEIAAIDDIVIDPTSGARTEYTVFRSSPMNTGTATGQLPYPFEATSIETDNGSYKIILNMSGSRQTLTSDALGLKGAIFAPYEVMKGYNFVFGKDTQAHDVLKGTDPGCTNPTGSDVIKGYAGNDTIKGLGGDDSLYGGLGRDKLTGGCGEDAFVFDTTPDHSFDTIRDFRHGEDQIRLDHKAFTAFKAQTELPGQTAMGELSADMFCIGRAAQDESNRIIYDPTTGKLFYDVDGTGPTAAVRFATLHNKPTDVSATDFYIF